MPRANWQAARLALGTASALGLARFAYGLLLPAMRHDLHWTLAEAGGMGTANGLGYLVGALATAVIVRRWGARTSFHAGMALTAASLAATTLSDTYPALLTARGLSGITGAVVFITGGVIASRLATRAGTGLPITVYFAGTGLGIAVTGATLPSAGQHWRLAWIGLAVAAAAATVVSWTAASTGDDVRDAASGRARVRTLWRPALAYLLFSTGYITYITFLSAYLADYGASLTQTTLIWTALGSAVLAAPALWSYPTEHWPGMRVLATLLFVLSAGSALALALPTAPVIFLSAVLYGATFMGVPAAITALIKANTPPADWTATLAAFTTVFAVGQTAGPWIAGAAADHFSTDATLAWTAILCALAAVIAAVHPSSARTSA
ncbi:YbfB/YjiJ family MFS transporter [Cryptosporangium phraense]|uniref:YbfB/YjiJ family MFS transporter n=2 Tax=Cryptosporangium phraense TaxID=2593070 RepID=A0A545AMK2_9ACTN|nr:YbfB/YjiJ family MFS transporter [Cryptosporangium phraense]